eukprot:TRINITY_DN27304_c0_g1_i1.p1 TRINITY_DN27304_c0_g1~~TRINITY_DN27304_c0_g1_i1.p1  ORF type:complete len:297 (+),score=66.75 TRINITY_DN27304_c0_g1_i1:38-892(+)
MTHTRDVLMSSQLRHCYIVLVLVHYRPLAEVQHTDIDAEDIREVTLSETQLRKQHKHMDLDGDGRLSLDEALRYAEQMSKIADKHTSSTLEELDRSKDGRVDLEELLLDMDGEHTDAMDENEKRENAARLAFEEAKFHAADANSDGALELDELASLLQPELQERVLAVMVAQTMKEKDKDGDGQLSLNEFWEIDERLNDAASEEETTTFHKLDTDGSGFLSANEIQSWESGLFEKAESMRQLFEVADGNRDGHVTSEELVAGRDAIAATNANYYLGDWIDHHEL